MLNQPLPRRRLLKLFASTGGVISALATTQLASCSFTNHEKDTKQTVYNTSFGLLLVMDEQRAKLLFSFAEACVSNSESAIYKAEVIQRIDEELYFVSTDISDDFLLALDVLEYLPLVYGCFSRFSQMPLLEREQWLVSMQQTRINTVSAVISACRMTVMLMFYGHESTMLVTGYDGTFSKMPQIMSSQRRKYKSLTRQVSLNTHEAGN